MARLVLNPVLTAFDNNGEIEPGAKLFFYQTGTSNLITVYDATDEGSTLTNPVIADAYGRFAPAFIAQARYKVVLKDASDNTLLTVDPVETTDGILALLDDTSPQLSNDLDLNGNGIAFPGATVTDVTGADTTVVSGTAGTDGNIAAWNTDGDLVDGSKVAADIVTGPASVTDGRFALFDGTTGKLLKEATVGVAAFLQLSGGTMTGNIALGSEWLSGDGADEGLTVSSNGGVGIGVAAVTAHQLHIQGQGGDQMVIENTKSSGNGYANFWVQGPSRTYQIGTGVATETALSVANKFFVYDRTGGAMRLVLDTSGQLGIGTATPSTRLHVNGPIRCASYTVGTVPSASTAGAGAQIYVTDDVGGAVPAFSDGTNWRRVTDRATITT